MRKDPSQLRRLKGGVREIRVANGKTCLERVAVGNVGNRSADGIQSNRRGMR